MATVRELLNTLTRSNGEQFVLVDDDKGNFIPLQHEFYVEDDTLFLFTEGDNENLTVNQLLWYIEGEAEDRCWHNGYGESLFLDCEVKIGFGTSDPGNSDCEYINTNAVYTGVNNVLIIRCDDSNGTTDDLVADVIRDVTINLSSDEVEMVKRALNYYGDKIADSEGYSSGEAYWNLINLF